MDILLEYDKTQLVELLVEKYAVKPYVGQQVFAWLNKGANFDDMTNISSQLRAKLNADFKAQAVDIVSSVVSSIDGTEKFLYQLVDGNVVEGVLMKYKYGNTLCLSTQVGCRMGCKFCASTIGGLVRNLTAAEILGQVVAVNARGEGRYITNIVLMGSGEPLDNYDNVLRFLQLVTSPDGLNISSRNISLSTCGIADKIVDLANSGVTVNLTISLHSASTESRAQIMPITNKYTVEQVMESARYYFAKTGRRVIIEYTLIDGVNDRHKDALMLASLVRGMSAHINCIRLNPVKGTRLSATTDINARKFVESLVNLKVSATLRRQMGVDIEGACGQLRRKYLASHND